MPSLTQRLGVQGYEADQEYKEALVAMQKRDRKAAHFRSTASIMYALINLRDLLVQKLEPVQV